MYYFRILKITKLSSSSSSSCDDRSTKVYPTLRVWHLSNIAGLQYSQNSAFIWWHPLLLTYSMKLQWILQQIWPCVDMLTHPITIIITINYYYPVFCLGWVADKAALSCISDYIITPLGLNNTLVLLVGISQATSSHKSHLLWLDLCL